MTQSPYALDITVDNFSQAVVEQSNNTLVVVDFWAPWCGPCKTLLPLMEKLAEDYSGQFVLAKVNVDDEQSLAAQFGVRSVPTVKLVKAGQVVDEFTGALPENAIREIIDRHIEQVPDSRMSNIHALLQNGHIEEAEAQLSQLLNEEPQNRDAVILQAEILAQRGRYAEAREFIRGLPEELHSEPSISSLLTRIEFAEVAEQAPEIEQLEQSLAADPDNSEARYQLSTLYLAAEEYQMAMDSLLELMRRDRTYKDDAGRKGLIKIFELLGNDHELVALYRRKMASILL